MDIEQEHMQSLGLFGIYKESYNIITSWKKIFSQITLALIFPLSFIFLAHMVISNRLFWNVHYTQLHYHRKVPSKWIAYFLFKAAYFTFLLIFSLLSTSAVVYTIASIYTNRDVTFKKVMKVVPKVWKRLMVTFLIIFVAIFVYIVVALLIISLCLAIGGKASVVLFIILLILFSVGFVYMTIVWQLASVVTVLEDFYGVKAMRKSKNLIKGKLWVALAIFFKLNFLLVAVQFFFGDRGSRESSAEWTQSDDFPNWYDQHAAESAEESKRWLSQQHSSIAHPGEPHLLYGTSSFPEKQQQYIHQHQYFSGDPVLAPKSSFPSSPPPGGRSQQPSPNHHSHHSNIPYHPGGHQLLLSSPSHSSFSNPQLQLATIPHGSQFGKNLPQFAPPGLTVNSRSPNQRVNNTSLHPGDHSSLSNNLLQQQLPHQNGLTPPQLMQQQLTQQHRLHHQFQPSFGHFSGMQPQLINRHLPPAHPIMNNFEVLGSTDLRDQPKSLPKARQDLRYSHQGSDTSSQRSGNGWPRFSSP